MPTVTGSRSGLPRAPSTASTVSRRRRRLRPTRTPLRRAPHRPRQPRRPARLVLPPMPQHRTTRQHAPPRPRRLREVPSPPDQAAQSRRTVPPPSGVSSGWRCPSYMSPRRWLSRTEREGGEEERGEWRRGDEYKKEIVQVYITICLEMSRVTTYDGGRGGPSIALPVAQHNYPPHRWKRLHAGSPAR